MQLQTTTTPDHFFEKIQDPITAIDRMGEWFCKSGMFGCGREAQGRMLAMACLIERKSPIIVAATYHIMEDGRITMQANAQYAKFRERGGRVKWKRSDAERCEAEFSFEGQSVPVTFTIEDAKRAELIRPKSAWVKRPGRMLRARCLTEGISMLCPEILLGGDDFDETETMPAATGTIIEEAEAAREPGKAANLKEAVDMAEAQRTGGVDFKAKLAARPEPPKGGTTNQKAAVGQVIDAEVVSGAATGIGVGSGGTSPSQRTSSSQGSQSPAVPQDRRELLKGLLALLDTEELQNAAMAWWIKKGKLKADQGPGDLPDNHLTQILRRPEEFKKAILGEK